MPIRKTPLTLIKKLPAFAESGIPEAYIDRELPRLGISTVEDFIGLLDALIEPMAAETGASPAALRALSEEAFAQLVPPENRRLFEVVPRRRTPFGVPSVDRADAIGEPVGQPDAEVVELQAVLGPDTLPSSVSLIDGCAQPSRDQGARPTCTVFAAVAVLEYLLCRFRNIRVDLSEQYLYWLLAQNGALTEARALLEDAFDVARTAGVCREGLWSYRPDFLPDDLTHGAPPDRPACEADASQHMFGTVSALSNPRDIGSLRQLLAAEHPVAVEIPLFESYWIEPLYYGGQIVLPLQNTGIVDRHVIVLVGYRNDPQDPTQNRFLVRNSVGPLWGRDSSLAPGHGTIVSAYIESLAEKAWFGRV